jgi:hypothetical protein
VPSTHGRHSPFLDQGQSSGFDLTSFHPAPLGFPNLFSSGPVGFPQLSFLEKSIVHAKKNGAISRSILKDLHDSIHDGL